MARNVTAVTEAIPRPGDRGAIDGWSDDHLLRAFLARTGGPAETAFAALIGRHGPVVHRVCLDVLGDREAARDAAQAVFLVLARKAGSIRKPGSLGPWLHGVALRVARRARVDDARRRAAERKKAEIMTRRTSPEPNRDPLGFAALHEEVDRLPEKYRQPIILCYMQGQTQAEAAEALGWPLGTVQVRLHRGREQLRARLTRRGVGAIGLLAGSGLATSLSAKAAGVPGRGWTEATAAAAVRFAARQETAGLVPTAAAELAESALSASAVFGPLKVVALLAIALVLGSAALRFSVPSKPARTLTGLNTRPAPSTVVAAVRRPKPILREAPAVVAATDRGAAGRPTPGLPRAVEPTGRDALAGPKPSPGLTVVAAPVDRRPEAVAISGRELFERVWVKDDRRGHGGDGLGPVFNGTSCLACHHLGGSGGAGGIDRNIAIATLADPSAGGTGFFYAFSMDFGAGRMDYRIGNAPGTATTAAPRVDPAILAAIHPGFRESRSVVLHHYGTDPAYNAWRGSVPGPHGTVLVRTSERNPPPLFGLGLIDAIPDDVIEAAAKRKFAGATSVKGRVSRLRDGRIGRFGWKAQTATLREFVVAAAAGEIGLEVPGGRQAADPRLPGIGASGLDMDASECDALTEYVRNLPAPVVNAAADDQEAAQVKAGEETFRSIGCAHCHVPKLGGVEGIYSDLLLHDMNPRLGDSDTYSVFLGGPPREVVAEAVASAATAREWRTPPLWGLRDSGPYLHDGRAATIDEAIALHAGQGASAAKRYADLSPRRKRHLTAFLKSLAAPPEK